MTAILFFQIISMFTGVLACINICILLIKPVREWLLGTKDVREGQKCSLRADMLRTYYNNREKDTIRQYEKENFILMYKAYKALGGNSFIDDIYEEIRHWEVIT